MEKPAEESDLKIYTLLILTNGQQIALGKPFLSSDQEVWLILFEPGITETATDSDADVDVAETTPPKYLVYPKEAALALRGNDAKKDVLVFEVFADKVLLATRSVTAGAVLSELKESMGGDERLKTLANNGQPTSVAQPSPG